MTDSSAPKHRHRRPGRRRFAPIAVVAGVVASAAIATSMTGTLGAFVAQITNSNNSAATGVLTMSETGPNNNNNSQTSVTCNSTDGASGAAGVTSDAYTCASINKYGASTTLVPGGSISTSVTITNTGTVTPSQFTLQPGVCGQSANGTVNGTATDLCSKIYVKVTQTGVSTPIIATTPLSTFGGTSQAPAAATSLTALAPSASATYTFLITFPSPGATPNDNAYQGLKASQTLAWTFSS